MPKGTNGDPSHDQLTRIADALEDIKRLMIAGAMRNGASQEDIAKALGVDRSSISRLFSRSKSKSK
jgi:DNA-directed RNA polymerase specialized sigma subunit